MNEQLQELLSDYLEGEISAQQRKQVEELLARDPELKRMVGEMQQARGFLRQLPVEAAPQYVREAIQQRIAGPRPIPLFSARRLLRIAAMLLLALGGGIVIWSMIPASRSPVAMETRAVPVARFSEAEALTEARKDAATALKSDKLAVFSNVRAVMVIKTSDVPAAQRQIGSFLASNNLSYASGESYAGAQEKVETPALGGPEPAVVAAPTPAPTATPMAKSSAPASPMGKSEAKAAERPAFAMKTKNAASAGLPGQQQAGGIGGAAAPYATRPLEDGAMAAARGQRQQQLTVRNMNQDQVRFIRENVYNMADGRKMQVASESPEVAEIAAGQSQLQGQLSRQAPYVQQRDMNQVRQQVSRSRTLQDAQALPPLYDLTIVVEPVAQLPHTSAAATLPSSRPR